jgi:hypothetical protein
LMVSMATTTDAKEALMARVVECMDYEVDEMKARIEELQLALCDLYNLCMAKGWGTSPMVREMLAARRAIGNEK